MIRDPIEKLIADHRVFLARTQEFRRTLQTLPTTTAETDVLPRRVARFAEFLHRDVDGIHGQQEERGLFPVLGRHLPTPGGPVEVMIAEHERLRGFQRDLVTSGRRIEADREDDDAFRRVVSISREVDALLSDHVLKEDSILFPMAGPLLTSRDREEIAGIFDEIEARLGSIEG